MEIIATYTHAFKNGHTVPLPWIAAEKVRSDQTRHAGTHYSHFLLFFALCDRHFVGALQGPMRNGLLVSMQ